MKVFILFKASPEGPVGFNNTLIIIIRDLGSLRESGASAISYGQARSSRQGKR